LKLKFITFVKLELFDIRKTEIKKFISKSVQTVDTSHTGS